MGSRFVAFYGLYLRFFIGLFAGGVSFVYFI